MNAVTPTEILAPTVTTAVNPPVSAPARRINWPAVNALALSSRIQAEANAAMHSAIVLKVESVEAGHIPITPLAIALEDLRKAVRCLEFVIERQKEPAQ